jgi:hypothetical protein
MLCAFYDEDDFHTDGGLMFVRCCCSMLLFDVVLRCCSSMLIRFTQVPSADNGGVPVTHYILWRKNTTCATVEALVHCTSSEWPLYHADQSLTGVASISHGSSSSEGSGSSRSNDMVVVPVLDHPLDALSTGYSYGKVYVSMIGSVTQSLFRTTLLFPDNIIVS